MELLMLVLEPLVVVAFAKIKNIRYNINMMLLSNKHTIVNGGGGGGRPGKPGGIGRPPSAP